MHDDQDVRRALLALASPPKRAESLFIHIVPRRKFPPEDRYDFPNAVWTALLTDIAIATLFDFATNDSNEEIDSPETFGAFIESMLVDRDLLFYRELTLRVSLDPPADVKIRVEYSFAKEFIQRLSGAAGANVSERRETVFARIAVFLGGLAKQKDIIRYTKDEHGNILAVAPAFCSDGDEMLFSSYMASGFKFGKIVRIFYGETESDIGDWERFGWMASTFQNSAWAGTFNLPAQSHKQAGIVGSILQKIAKFVRKDPG